MKLIGGIDPGNSGGITLLTFSGKVVEVISMPPTERDLVDFIEKKASEIRIVWLENVHAMPGQGVTSMFSFGKNYGFLIGVLFALKIPFNKVTPQRWQKEIGVPPRKMKTQTEHKNNTKSLAQQLFPNVKVTHAIADSLLIAEWGRRNTT